MIRKFPPSRRLALCAVAAFTLGFGQTATATTQSEWSPTRAVTLVDGFAPGGSTDILARVIGQELNKSLGQSIIVENKSGAGGIVATSHVARAAPDGHTLLVGTIGPTVVNPHILADLSYDPLEDLIPVLSLVNVGNALVARADHPVKDVKSLIQMAKENPDSIDFGSSGIGTTGHLAGEIFQQETNVKFTHIPYRGGAPAVTALLAGEIDIIFSSIPTAVEHVKSGSLQALAVTGEELETLPGVPPLKEAGVPNYVLPSWYGLFAPAGTPQEAIDRIAKEVKAVLEIPKVRDQLISLGMVPNPVSTEHFQEQVKADSAYWADLVQKANIKMN